MLKKLPAKSLLRVFPYLTLVAMLFGTSLTAAECPFAASDASPNNKVQLSLYVQGDFEMEPPAWVISHGEHVSPEERLINECSTAFSTINSAVTISDSLPERLNVFAHLPETARNSAFVTVSSVDQKMAMDKTGPYWHSYVMAFPDLRFVGATVRLAFGLVTLDESIQSSTDLVGKRVGLVMRPSSLRALQEIVLIKSWGIYDKISVQEYLPAQLPEALARNEVDAIFTQVGRMAGNRLLPLNIDFDDAGLRWISISEEDVVAATDNTPVLAERVVFSPRTGATNGNKEVGLITFDAAWFTFASAPNDVVYEFIHTASQVCPPQAPDCGGRSPESLVRWPQLDTNLIHPGALKFYREAGVALPEGGPP